MGAYLNIGTFVNTDLVTKVQAILAKRDMGKTYLAGVVEEEFIKNNLPFVVIDPMHAHYGLRSKYYVPVLGPVDPTEKTFQPDIEIEPWDGPIIAQMVGDFNQSCILDISNWDEDTQREFVTGFCDWLFKINKTPRHLFIEEADIFAPQIIGGNPHARKSKHALNTIVRRGRGRGLGATLITQRPQVIDKSILNQADIYQILHVSGHHEISAIKFLLQSYNMDKALLKKTLEKIIKFKPGDCLLYSPSWLSKIKVYKVRAKETYHAGATPQFNQVINFNPVVTNVTPIIDKLNLLHMLINR